VAHGLLPWAERARRELRATGEAGEEPGTPQRACLSPQELQIAQLAAGGLSNREIAERLYLSHRTVGSHLYRIFPKLGITSRIQLPSVLATAGASPAAGLDLSREGRSEALVTEPGQAGLGDVARAGVDRQ
jgi:DNA-binding NarL/FixJ family response regulator